MGSAVPTVQALFLFLLFPRCSLHGWIVPLPLRLCDCGRACGRACIAATPGPLSRHTPRLAAGRWGLWVLAVC